ncbi:MAG TPA: glycosyltransferase family 2 protein [Solirubrobacterales bacterium]|nr:glycosyltransferase family 2 protein [Solirubrobacterales bacterium]
MDSDDQLLPRLEAVEGRLDALQELLTRAYEETPRRTAEVMSVRRDPRYAEAYAERPLVTVRIGVYRPGEILFDRALSSIRAQTYEHWEAILVCDGRDEETAARVAQLGDKRIRVVERPRNGPYPDDPAARWRVAGVHPFNQAVALGRGAWIAPIDQDDEWSPGHLEVLLAAARRTGAEVVYGAARVVLTDGEETYFGSWPPRLGDFGFQTAIYLGLLAPIAYDVNSHLTGEPADWNLARRMLEAGVSFEFVERIVASYWPTPGQEPEWGYWQNRLREVGVFAGGAG